MKHIHDTDPHFKIDPVTRAITTTSLKIQIIQGDHNSERFTFEVPRTVEGHDLSLCDKVQVHYINISKFNKDDQSVDVYETDDFRVSPTDATKVTCSWLISGNATKYEGPLSFVVRFVCLTGGKVSYSWSTAIYNGINVSAGINNGESVVTEYSDVLEEWYQRLIEAGGPDIVQTTGDSDKSVMSQKATTEALSQRSNALKGTASGEAIAITDASPLEHEMGVKVFAQNIFDASKLVIGGLVGNTGADWETGGNIRSDYCSVEPNTTYNFGGSSNVWNKCHAYDKDKKWLSQVNITNGAFFITPTNAAFVRISFVKSDGTAFTNEELEAAKQEQLWVSSTATAYTPCDISTVKVKKIGLNLWDEQWESGTILSGNGATQPLADTIRAKNYISVKANVKYRIIAPQTVRVVLYDNNKSFVSASYPGESGGYAFTPKQDGFMRFAIVAGVSSGAPITEYGNNICVSIFDEGTNGMYEPYKEETFIPEADGTVNGIVPNRPTTTLMTDTSGAVIDCTYNRDINKAFEELWNAIISTGGNV
jgi:hypothetical protein